LITYHEQQRPAALHCYDCNRGKKASIRYFPSGSLHTYGAFPFSGCQ